MDLQKMDLMSSMKMLAGLLGIYAAFAVLKFITLILIGVVAQVATGGSISIPAAINTTINSSIGIVSTNFGLLDAGVAIVLGLIGLVVIINLFWGLIAPYFKGKVGSKGNNNF